MADNLTTQNSALATPPASTVIATDEIGGVHVQRVKLTWGTDGTANDASASNPVPVTLANTGANATAVKVDGSAVTQPVSLASTTITGTVAATQSGTWNVTNISGTVSLPTGAATAAKQPALGTAGSASADVISVQGIASMTALKTDGSAVTQPVSGTVSAAQSGTWTVQPGNTANTTAWKVDGSAVTQPVSDASGSLTVDAPVATPVFVRLSDGAAAITTLAVSLASVPSHAVTNAGTFAVQVDGSALTSLQLIDDTIIADDAAFTVGTTKVNVAGFLADESSTDSVDEGDVGAARMSLDRKIHVITDIESSSMRVSGVAATPKFATIAASSSGNNTIVAAVNPKKLRVLAAQLVANGAVNAKWQSGASGTDLTGLAYLAANGGLVLPYNPVGWFETASNTLLNLNLSGAVAVGGSITYIEV